MNYKRKKPRTQVRCVSCTPIRKRMNGKRDDGLIAGRTRVRQGKKFWPKAEE